MNTNNSRFPGGLRYDVMDRVRTVRGIRSYIASPMLSALFTGLFLFFISIMVSIGDVLHNIMAQSHWGGRFSYTFWSLLHSRLTVQALALLTMISFFMVFLRSFPRLRAPLYFMSNFILSRSPLKFFRS